MIILKANCCMSKDGIKRAEQILSEKTATNVVIIPIHFDVVATSEEDIKVVVLKDTETINQLVNSCG